MAYKKKFSWVIIAGVILIPILALIDMIFPFLFRMLANRYLNKVSHLSGKLKALHVSFLKRAITIKGLEVHYGNVETDEQIFSASVGDIIIKFDWLKLLSKCVALDIMMDQPVISVIQTTVVKKSATTALSKQSGTSQFPVLLKGLNIKQGTLKYTNFKATPTPTIELKDIELHIENQTGEILNEAGYKVKLQARVCDGELLTNINVKLNNTLPSFDMAIKLTELNLVMLNTFFLAYGKVDVSKGYLDIFSEVTAEYGKFKGYVKPIIKDLEFLGPDDTYKDVMKNLWEIAVGTVVELIENQRHDQVATEIPFEGTFKVPKVNILYAIVLVFVNAFIHALSPDFDHRFNKRVTKID